jgi:hypothetical protein
MMAQNPVRRLTDLGQSVWLDYIERGFVRGGALPRARRGCKALAKVRARCGEFRVRASGCDS